MKHAIPLAVISALILPACGQKPSEEPFVPVPIVAPAVSSIAPAPVLDTIMGKKPQAAAEPQLTEKGLVKEVIQLPQYTYIEVEQEGKSRWLAAINATVKKGDKVRFDAGTTMENFNSKQLNRTFPSITFVSRVVADN